MRTLLTMVCLASGAVSQASWLLNSGGSIDPTIALASPGDILLLDGTGGPFLPFTLNKGLTLIAVTPVRFFEASASSNSVQTTIAVPAGERARLVGLEFRSFNGPNWVTFHTVEVDGDVAFEHCRFSEGATATVRVAQGNVRMHHCFITGAPSRGAMQIDGGICALTDCFVAGGAATIGSVIPLPFPSRPGLLMTDGALFASRCTFVGGDAAATAWPAFHYEPPSPGILMTGGTARLSLTDSQAVGGSGMTTVPGGSGPGAVALAAPTLGTGSAKFARTGLSGGTGTVNGGASTGNATADPELVGISIDQGLVHGVTSTVTAAAGSSQQLLALVGGFDGTVATNALVVEPVYGQPAGLTLLVVVVPPAGGPVAHAIAVPNDPGLVALEVWFQAYQLAGPRVHASPAVGGIVR